MNETSATLTVEASASPPAEQEVFVFPPSFAQQRLWFLAQLQPEAPVYLIGGAFLFEGRLSIPALHRSLQAVVDRHESLRTSFNLVDGEPMQIVRMELEAALPSVDLRQLSRARAAAEMKRLVTARARRPFDLARAPLFRFTLFELGESEHVLQYAMHHTILDGWSEDILLREVAVLYEAFAAGRPSPLPELPIQYGDYAQWQRDELTDEALAADVDWWRRRLADVPQILDLPTDRPRPAIFSYRGALSQLSLPDDTAAALRALGRDHGTTLFMSLLATFGGLLGRYAGQPELLIGTPVANRDQVELEGLVGLLVNTLVLPVDLSQDPTVGELLAQVRETVHSAQEHQDLPFERLVAALDPARDESRNPLFQAMLGFQSSTVPAGAPDGLRMRPLQAESGTTQVDFQVTFKESATGGLNADVGYCTDLFDHTTVERLMRNLETLLSAFARSPARRLGELPLLDAAQRQMLLCEWNDSQATPPAAGELCLHEWIAARAARDPDAVAVVDEAGYWSYRELDGRADWLAHRLRQLGAGPERCVGIAVERSAERMVGLLAILKAGSAYVPLDSSYPEERLSFMVKDARVSALIASEASAGALSGLGVPILRQAAGARRSGGAPLREGDDPGPGTRPDNLVYALYTSGSTGKPKGAMNTHRAVVNRLLWMQETYPLSAGDGVLQKTPFSFDVSVWELFWPLMRGARLVLARPGGQRDPAYLAALILRHRITIAHFVPSMLAAFLAEPIPKASPSLRQVIVSGEALPPELERRFLTRFADGGQPRLDNLYGPTEAAIDVTAWPCGPAPSSWKVAIGRPVTNTRIHVLDRGLRQVPFGGAGELCIGGVQLARGYSRRPALTADRFVPDPIGDRPGERLYRTGDRARHLASGAVDFLGRIDHQVKVRGFRIELGEIEAVLGEHPAVQETVVAVATEGPRAGQLVAYLVGEPEPPSAEELRRFLLRKLPEPMAPAAFVSLPALPVTAHGKVDRRALPAPGGERPELQAEYVAPRTPVEETLAGIWARALGLDRVGVEDNLFALGGDSIRSLEVVARAREAGLAVTLLRVFRFPTIALLAAELDDQPPVAADAAAASIAPFALLADADRRELSPDVEDAYPLAMLQIGMLYHQAENPEAPLFHNVNSHRLQAPFDRQALERAVHAAVMRHPALRTSFDMTGFSEPLQLVHRHCESPLTMEDLRHLSPETQEQTIFDYCWRERHRPFRQGEFPQIRFHAQRVSDDAFQFSLTENHAVIDGWSLHLVYSEMLRAYAALLDGSSVPALPALRSGFRDFIHLERQALSSPRFEAFWASWLEGSSPLRLPRSSPPPPRDGRRVRRLDVPLPEETVAALQRLAESLSVPLKSVLLAAHLKVMGFLADRDDVLTGMSSNGRLETTEGQQICGLFLNTLPLRLDLAGGDWRDLVRRTHGTELEMMPFRRYPLAAIQKRWGRQELLETSFVYLNFHVLKEAVQDHPFEEVDTGEMIEETNFVLIAAFQHELTDRGSIFLDLSCDHTVLSDAQIDAIAGYYLRTLRAIAETPEASHRALRLLSPAEQHRLAIELNDTRRPAPGAMTVPELFARQAARAPDRTAVVGEGAFLSFRGLERAARRLAGHLRRQGVGQQSRVAVCLDRSPEMVVAVLGVLAAGGAYVPLDPGHPPERLRFQIADAGARWILSRSAWREKFTGSAAQVYALDAQVPSSATGEEDGAPLADPAGGHLAYVVYTSGSTGRPKAVAIEHRQLANYLHGVIATLSFRPGMSFALVSTVAADLGHTMLFPPLVIGGALHTLSETRVTDPAALAEAFTRHPIDCLKIVPSHLAALLSHDESARLLLPARRLVLGGEAVRGALLDRIRSLAPRCRIFNHYGPTETTVGVLVHPIAGAPEIAAEGGARGLEAGSPPLGRPPLGRPLPNVRIYVASRKLRPLAAGVAGELYIAGAALARGYLGQGAATAAAFLPDPFADRPGGRLYRSGDQARFLSDGRVDFLGRVDHQVKIRGFRIEPEEVASVLARHPDVAEAAVVARTDDGEPQLVAYTVAREGRQPTAEELRAFLADRLPTAMVPAAFVELAALPLTANGKLDRQALPSPTPRDDERYVAPRSALEERLARLLGEILDIERVGVFDNFFELGGDSIRFILAIARIREELGVELSMETLFELPTIDALAPRIEQDKPEADAALLNVELRPIPRDGELPLSFSQQRLWYLHLLMPESPAYNMPHALRLHGAIEVPILERSLQEVCRRHEVLRSRYPTVDGAPSQVVSPVSEIVVPVADLRALRDVDRRRELERITHSEALRPFDLGRGPLLRPLLVRLAEEEHGALLTVHHIVFDAWSLGVLMREMATLYEAIRLGQPSPLPELPIQYVDFAAWQRRWLSGEVLERQLAYWRDQLRAAPQLRWAERPQPGARSYRGASTQRILPSSLAEALRDRSQGEQATLFMTLLAGYAILLHHYTGQQDIIVGTPVADGRNLNECEGLIGLFLNSLPLRARLHGDPSFRELLGRIRDMALGAYAHQEVPFDKMVSALELGEERGHSPLFRVWFNHANLPRQPLQLREEPEQKPEPKTEQEPRSVGTDTVKFDLLLTTQEMEDHIIASLGFNTDFFDRFTAESFLIQLEAVLCRVAEHPDTRLGTLRQQLTDIDAERRKARRQSRHQARHRSLRGVQRRAERVVVPPQEAKREQAR